jgi:pimeloyl-ACP methyl ester carboxylesterase
VSDSLPCFELDGNPDQLPLVVLLGLPSSPAGSRRLLERLAGTRPLLAVSPTSHAPGRPDWTPSWADLVEWLEDRLDQRGFARVDVIGWSFGGAWSLQWLARRPQRVRRAVLAVSTAHFRVRERSLLRLLQALLRAPLEDELIHAGLLPMLFSADFLHRPGVFQMLRMHLEKLSTSRAEWAAQLDNLVAHDVRKALPELTMVHTVIAGAQDWLFPASEVRRLAAALPCAQFEQIESGHGIWFEAEDEFVELVHRALAAPEAGDS